MEGYIYRYILLMGDFNTSYSVQERLKKKEKRCRSYQCVLNFIPLQRVSIYRYTFFISAYGILTKINPVLDHKENIREVEIL